MRFTLKPKLKPKWYQFRLRLAFGLVRLARWIKPNNDAAMSFMLEELVNDMIVENPGMFKVIPPEDFFIEPQKSMDLN